MARSITLPLVSLHTVHTKVRNHGVKKKKENFKFNQIVKDGKQNVFSLEGHVLY